MEFNLAFKVLSKRDSTPERDEGSLQHSMRSRFRAHLDAYSKDTGVLSFGVDRQRYESDVLLPPGARVVSGAARSSRRLRWSGG
jgi:hypothetical protein